MSGFGAGMMFEGMLSDMEKASMQQAYHDSVADWARAYYKMRASAAKYRAFFRALQHALAAMDPDHPLLREDGVLKKIEEITSKMAATTEGLTWAEVDESWKNVSYSYESPVASKIRQLTQKINELQEKNQELQRRLEEKDNINAMNFAEKVALRYYISVAMPNHPALTPEFQAKLKETAERHYAPGDFNYNWLADLMYSQIARDKLASTHDASMYDKEAEDLRHRLDSLTNPEYSRDVNYPFLRPSVLDYIKQHCRSQEDIYMNIYMI